MNKQKGLEEFLKTFETKNEVQEKEDVEKILNAAGREMGIVYPDNDIVVFIKGGRSPYFADMLDYCDFKSTQILVRLCRGSYRRIRWDKIDKIYVMK